MSNSLLKFNQNTEVEQKAKYDKNLETGSFYKTLNKILFIFLKFKVLIFF